MTTPHKPDADLETPRWDEPTDGPQADDLSEDPRLLAAVKEYQEALAAGQPVDRREFAARYPELAAELEACLQGLDLLNAMTSESVARSRTGTQSPKGAGPFSAADELGDFRIVREIGRGGMGVVYEAWQLSLGRRVALKVLPFAGAFDPRQLQRFRHEAQAAAQLHHSHIVPVYAVGCERGVHFYAMQLIEGQSLAELIRQLREQAGLAEELPNNSTAAGQRSAAKPTTSSPLKFDTTPGAATLSLSTARSPLPAAGPWSQNLSMQRGSRKQEFFRVAARLALQAAEALDYAHQFGVIHRDIKPGNLLIDGRGHLWITDFGLAQFQTDFGLTQTGDLVGTLRYASPEQVGGQKVLVDQRADVYALGASLYELLTLHPLFEARHRTGLLHQVLTQEPRAPRAVDRQIPAELETVLLKALAKNPLDRYATARELADDLQRFLLDQPILARRPTPWVRTQKWLRRHPSVVVSTVVVLLLGVVGLGISNWMVEREKQVAVGRLQQAREVVDLLIEISNEDLSDRLFHPDPRQQGLQKRLLEKALTYYQDFIEETGDDPAMQEDLKSAQVRIQSTLADLAVLQGAFELFLLETPRNRTWENPAPNEVRADLGVTAEQSTRLDEYFAKLEEQRREMFRGAEKLKSSEMRSRIAAIARGNETAVEKILTPEQRRRLRQISHQQRGLMVFADPEVVTALGLSEDQLDSVRQIERQMLGAAFSRPKSGRRVPRDLEITAFEQVRAMLTSDQQKKWQDYFGETYRGQVVRGPHDRGGMMMEDCPPGEPHKGPPGPRPGPPPDRRD